MLFNPIYTKRRIISNEMKEDFRFLDKIWLEHSHLWPIDWYECNTYSKIVRKIRNNDFDFNEEDIKNTEEILCLILYCCAVFLGNPNNNENGNFSRYYTNDNIGSVIDKIKSHLHFITEPILDYEKMKENNKDFFEDLCQSVFHPERVNRLSDKLGVELDNYLNTI